MWLAVLTCKWDGVIILNSWSLPFFLYFTSAYLHTHIHTFYLYFKIEVLLYHNQLWVVIVI